MTYFAAADRRYDQMTYRRSGHSGLRLPAISLGLWHNFGPDRPFERQQAIVRRAFDLGVTHFDLAKRMATIRGLGAVAERRDQSLAQPALVWALRDPRMTSLIIGASSVPAENLFRPDGEFVRVAGPGPFVDPEANRSRGRLPPK